MDTIMGDGDKARGAGIDNAMRILAKDRLQHLVEPTRVQDGAFHERDASDIQRRETGKSGRRCIRVEAEHGLAQMAVVKRKQEGDEGFAHPALAVEDEVNLPDRGIPLAGLCLR